MDNPTFIIIGAAKSGTSAIYSFLRQHPQIYMSPKKEPYYFALQGETVEFKAPGDKGINHRAVTTLDEYEALFAERTDELQSGEASTLYLYSKQAAGRIKAQRPDAKLIAVLRNPVERAFSSYLHTLRDGWETSATFAEALAAEPERIAANWSHIWHYQQAGFYADQIERYLELFPREQLLILLYDDLKASPSELLQTIYQFLDVDPSFEVDTSRRYNVSGKARFAGLQRWIVEPNRLKTMTKSFVPTEVRLGIRQKLLDLNVTSAKPASLLPSDRERLHAIFHDDILRLQKLINRDLTHWL